MSLLSLVTETCRRLAIPEPNAVATTTDKQILQLLALANEEGEELAERYPWQVLQTETSFTTVAAEVQGSLSTIAPGCKYVINDTIFNRDLRRPVFGPLGPARWQQLKSQFIQGPYNQYRIVGDQLKFIPAPVAGESCFFEYVSRNWCVSADGMTTRSAWGADDDVGLLDEQLMRAGLMWRWNRAKGLEYAELFAAYERRVMDAMARDGSKPTLNLGGTREDIAPTVTVPAGSWNL